MRRSSRPTPMRSAARVNPTRPDECAPVITFSRTVSAGNSARFWNVRATPSSAMRCEGTARRFLPSKSTVPVVAWYRRLRTLNRVVLPAPFGPMSAQITPSSTVKERPSSATTPPKRTPTSSTLSSAMRYPGSGPSRRQSSRNGQTVWPPSPERIDSSSGTRCARYSLPLRGSGSHGYRCSAWRLRSLTTSGSGSHEHHPQLVVGLDAAAGAEDDALEGRLDEVDRDLGLVGDALREALQHAAAAHEVHAPHDEVVGELGWGLTEAGDHRVDDRADRLVDRVPHLGRVEDHVLGQAAHQVAPAHLGLDLVLHRPRGPDRDLDVLRGALTHRDAVPAPDVGLDARVDVERPDPDRLQGDDAAEADERGLGGAAADVDHMLASGSLIERPAPMAAAIGCS